MRRFKEKTVVITGAGSDIGRAVALRLVHEGANVVLIGSTKDRLEATVDAFPHDNTWIHSDHHFTIVGDIANPDKVTAMMAHINNRFDGIDVVVNTIGFAAQQSMSAMTDDDILQQMQALQTCAIAFSHASYPSLSKTHGNIVNILTCPNDIKPDMQQLHAKINQQGYHLTRQLAVEFAKNGVRVNSIDSSMVTRRDADKKSLLHRLPTAEDIAAGIAFLASSDAAMITGITLPIDAGISALELS